MTDNIIAEIKRNFELKELDVGGFSVIKASGMTFRISQYNAQGLGNVSVMSASGMLGLMKMDTVIINPFERDVPLFSYDRIHALGNDTLIIELYDTQLGKFDSGLLDAAKAGAAALPVHDLGSHWYDEIKLSQSLSARGKKAQSAAFDGAVLSYATAFSDTAARTIACDIEAKRARAAEYTEKLLSNGGPSTDAFKKAIGEQKTAELFRSVIFGTGNA